VLYIMYVMYKTVLAGCEGAEWGTERPSAATMSTDEILALTRG